MADQKLNPAFVAIAGLVALALLVSPWACGVVVEKILVREVGPDAGEMAKDPVLNLTFEDAAPRDVVASTGTEGGVAPALANPDSSASRSWSIGEGRGIDVLRDAAAATDALGAVFWQLRCDGGSFTYTGRKAVQVHGDAYVMSVHVSLDIDLGPVKSSSTVPIGAEDWASSPAKLRISLHSGDHSWRLEPRQGADKTHVTDNCPPELAARVAAAS